MKFAPGQKLWFVPVRGRIEKGVEVSIEKIGNKWLTLSNGRQVDARTLMEKTEFTPGRAWLCRQDYEDEVQRNRAWDRLRHAVSQHYQPPKTLSTQRITQAMEILGIDVFGGETSVARVDS